MTATLTTDAPARPLPMPAGPVTVRQTVANTMTMAYRGLLKIKHNPEQLFAAGYSACFLGAMKFVAGQEKLKISDNTTVTATVGIGPRDDGKGFGIDVELAIQAPGLDRAAAEALVQKAHVVCPYSHATKGNVDVRLKVV